MSHNANTEQSGMPAARRGSDLPPCTRCGHPPDWHRISSEAAIQDPDDERTRFRCLGYDCEVDPVSPVRQCDCPNYERWARS